MTISQALRRIAKLKGSLQENLVRAAGAVSYVEGAPPEFPFANSLAAANALRDFANSLAAANAIRGELTKLEAALQVTNAQTLVDFEGSKITLAEATIHLQEAKSRIAWLKTLPCQAPDMREGTTVEGDELGEKRNKVVKIHFCALREDRRANLIEEEQDKFDTLNDAVESINHITPLVVV